MADDRPNTNRAWCARHLLCSIGVFIISFGCRAEAETLLQRGIAQYRAGQNQQAVSTLMSAMQQNVNDPAVHYHLANALTSVGDFSRALREYQLGYSLGQGGQLGYYCQQGILGCKEKMAHLGNVQAIRTNNLKAVTEMNPTVGNDSYALRGVHCPVGSFSHPDGVDKIPQGPPPAEYHEWIKLYDRAVRKRVVSLLPTIKNWQTLNGTCELYLTVTSSKRLRARVERSNTDEAINAMMLQIVRELDGTPVLMYPFAMDGFHFWHGIIYDDLVAQLRGQYRTTTTAATVTNRTVGAVAMQRGLHVQEYHFKPTVSSDLSSQTVLAKLLTPTPLKATQLRLLDFVAGGKIINKDVSAQLVNPSVSGKFVAPGWRAKAGSLDPDLRDVHAELFSSNASGHLLDPALRGTAGQLPDPALKEVNGQLYDPEVKGQLTESKASGQLVSPDIDGAKKDVNGQVIDIDAAKKDVNGQVIEDSAKTP